MAPQIKFHTKLELVLTINVYVQLSASSFWCKKKISLKKNINKLRNRVCYKRTIIIIDASTSQQYISHTHIHAHANAHSKEFHQTVKDVYRKHFLISFYYLTDTVSKVSTIYVALINFHSCFFSFPFVFSILCVTKRVLWSLNSPLNLWLMQLNKFL